MLHLGHSFFAIQRMSPLLVKGVQNLDRQGYGSFTSETFCGTGPRFIQSHSKDRTPYPTAGVEPAT
jgi:hypothetical protein